MRPTLYPAASLDGVCSAAHRHNARTTTQRARIRRAAFVFRPGDCRGIVCSLAANSSHNSKPISVTMPGADTNGLRSRERAYDLLSDNGGADKRFEIERGTRFRFVIASRAPASGQNLLLARRLY